MAVGMIQPRPEADAVVREYMVELDPTERDRLAEVAAEMAAEAERFKAECASASISPEQRAENLRMVRDLERQAEQFKAECDAATPERRAGLLRDFEELRRQFDEFQSDYEAGRGNVTP